MVSDQAQVVPAQQWLMMMRCQLPAIGSNGGLYLGVGETLDGATFFSGLIDDVRIYDAALTPEDIGYIAQ